jgi:hypothetical protein
LAITGHPALNISKIKYSKCDMRTEFKLLTFACSAVIVKIIFLLDQVTCYVHMHVWELHTVLSSSVKEKL